MTSADHLPERVLVTGATGFLGGAVVRALEDAGYSVRASGRRREPNGTFREYVAADVADAPALRRAVEGIHTVVHCAGLTHRFRPVAARLFFDVNVRGTAALVEAAARARVSRFLLVSSVAVYGARGGTAPDESTPCHPDGPYATSRRAAEEKAASVARRHGLPLTILRMATVYGEGDPGNVARLMRAIDRGRFIWVGDGSNRKSLIHRQDAACAVAAALKTNVPAAVFNVAGAPERLRDVVEELGRALGKSVPRLRIPAPFARGLLVCGAAAAPVLPALAAARETLAKWLRDDVFEDGRFRRASGFTPRVTLREGLAREVAWYRSLG